jgi:hypothetical protein
MPDPTGWLCHLETSSSVELLMVSSGGSLALGLNVYSPRLQPRADSTAPSPSPLSDTAWNRCPNRK